MVHQIITAENLNLEITLPEDYLGKEVEVIAFVVEKKEKPFVKLKNPFTTLQIDTRGFKFDRDETNER